MTMLDVQMADGDDGRTRGRFGLVIQQVTEQENVTAVSLAARV